MNPVALCLILLTVPYAPLPNLYLHPGQQLSVCVPTKNSDQNNTYTSTPHAVVLVVEVVLVLVVVEVLLVVVLVVVAVVEEVVLVVEVLLVVAPSSSSRS